MVLLAGQTDDGEHDNSNTNLNSGWFQPTEADKTICEHDIAFALNLFRATIKADSSDGNVLISPFGISSVLAMLYNGASGNAKLEIEQAMNYDELTETDIHSYYKNIQTAMQTTDQNATALNANSIWVKKDFNPSENFLNTNKDSYNALIKQVDFTAPATLPLINECTAEHTNGKINSIIDNIPGDAIMFLINALYFNAEWTNSFPQKRYEGGNFT
jgi:serpin B